MGILLISSSVCNSLTVYPKNSLHHAFQRTASFSIPLNSKAIHPSPILCVVLFTVASFPNVLRVLELVSAVWQAKPNEFCKLLSPCIWHRESSHTMWILRKARKESRKCKPWRDMRAPGADFWNPSCPLMF